jgi:hypothetical protein
MASTADTTTNRDSGAGCTSAEAGERAVPYRRQRRWARLKARWRVTFDHTSAFTADLGGGGFSAELQRVLSPGSTVEGRLHGKDGELPFHGVVAWAKAGDAFLGIRGRMGIAFAGPRDLSDELYALARRSQASASVSSFLAKQKRSTRSSGGLP